jgi:LPXTG-motif cell wall-anchored protein
LLKSRFRRTTAIVAGAFIGLAGAVALVSPASAHHTSLVGVTDCLENGGWKVDWTLTPIEAPIEGQITKVTETAGGSDLTTIKVGTPVPTSGKITDTQSFDKATTEVTLKVEVTWFYENQDLSRKNHGGNYPKHNVVYTTEANVKAPADCPQPSTPPTTTPPAPGEPTPILEEDCTTITIGLDNPADGKTITLDFKTSKGETRTTVIKPGEKKTEKFSAVPGFTVTVTPTGFEGHGAETIAYEKPADCDTAGSGGGLPVTGAAAGTIAGGAGLLLAIGAVLFVVSRRRKVKFTA